MYMDKRMGIWNIAMNSRVLLRDKLSQLISRFIKIFNMCEFSFFFFFLSIYTLPEHHHDDLMFASPAFNQLYLNRLKIQSYNTNL